MSELERLSKILSVYKRNVGEAIEELEELTTTIDDDYAIARIELIINILEDFGGIDESSGGL